MKRWDELPKQVGAYWGRNIEADEGEVWLLCWIEPDSFGRRWEINTPRIPDTINADDWRQFFSYFVGPIPTPESDA